jgi:hypothetical protein
MIATVNQDTLRHLNFSHYAYGVIDFEKMSYESSGDQHYFDLASLTKVLTLGALFAKSPELFKNPKHLLLLNHQGSLPSWGRLDKKCWKEQLQGYKITEGPTVYSDFSSLRLMLEMEKLTGQGLQELSNFYWDKELVFWKELEDKSLCAPTGTRNGEVIRGDVHDDNAFTINEFCSHTGLFSTINGICQSLLNLQKVTDFISSMDKALSNGPEHRFVNGFDRVENLEKTLAGPCASLNTFGFLGFTGTSFWIDSKTAKGHVLLTNATEHFWFERSTLNQLRKEVSQMAFS